MSVPSSTSSSKAGAARRALLQSLAWCGLLLVVARSGVQSCASHEGFPEDIPNAVEFLRRAQNEDIRVLALGSSQLQAAFLAEEWSRRAKLGADQVVNAAVPSGRFFDALHLLREVGRLQPSVERVIVEVSPWSFNANLADIHTQEPAALPPGVQIWGTLGDRLSVDEPLDRLHLTAYYVWPLYQRRPLEAWLDVLRGGRRPTPRLPDPVPFWDAERREFLARNRPYLAHVIVRKHFKEPRISGFTVRNLTALLERLSREDVDVALVRVPTRRGYLAAIREQPTALRFHDEVRAIVDSHVGGRVSAIWWEQASDCRLPERIFVDYGHMSRSGARAFTSRLFDEIERPRRVRQPSNQSKSRRET